MTYEETMEWGAAQYADVTAALASAGLPAEFTQTGGMCAALVVQLEAGHYLLLTDAEDTLSWNRFEHSGWWVGLCTGDGGEVVRDAQTDADDFGALLATIDEVLLPGRTASADQHESQHRART